MSRNTSMRSLPRSVARAASLLSATIGTVLLTAGTASAQTDNPLDGISPDLGVFGPTFQSTWSRIAGGIWGAVLAVSAVNLIISLYKIRKARAGGYQSELSDSMDSAKTAGVAFGCVAGAGIIVGASCSSSTANSRSTSTVRRIRWHPISARSSRAPSNRPRQQQYRRDILGEDGRDQRMEGGVRQTASWFKYGLVILLVVTILGIILAGLSGGSSESDTVRTGHGPNSITNGVPHGYDHTEAGAQTAAANFVQAVSQIALGRVTAADLKNNLVGDGASDALIAIVEDNVSHSEDTVMNNIPVLVNVTDYSDDRAVVSVWAVSASQSDLSGTGKISVLTVWSTTTVTLEWENGDWKAVDWAFRSGPEPEEVSFPEGDSTLAEFGANGLYTFFVE